MTRAVRVSKRPRASARWVRPVAIWAAFMVGLGLTPMIAQDTGGLTYRLGVSQNFQARTNPGLTDPSGSTRLGSSTNLSFGFTSRTRSDAFSFSAATAVQARSGESLRALDDRSFSLGYERESRASLLQLSAFLNEARLDTFDTDFVLLVPGDIPEFDPEEEFLLGIVLTETTATRRRQGGSAGLTFGRDAPFGGTFRIGQSDTRYSGTNNPNLVDNERRNASLTLRYRINPVLSLTTGVSVSQFQETGGPRRQTEALSLGASLNRPDGNYSLNLSRTQTPEGARTALSLGRAIELPRGNLSLSAGASTTTSGGSRLIASASWAEQLPNGTLRLGLARSVTGDARDRETLITALTASTTRALTPNMSGQANIGLQETRRTGDGETTRNLTLGASVNYALTEDWAMRAGAAHRVRSNAGTTASSTTLFLTLNRDFIMRR